MNYIKEINAFYQHQETNPLTSHAANLWHTLMHISNRTGWKTRFTVAVSVICCKSGLTNSTFKRARTELRDKGYIRYESRQGNQAAIYEMISLHKKCNHDSSTDEDTNSDLHQVTEQVEEKQSKHTELLNQNDEEKTNQAQDLNHNVVPLVKQKEIEPSSTSSAAEALTFFEENFGKTRPYVIHELIKWVDKLGESLVVEAMKRALDRGKETWGYVRAILQDWQSKGFKTIAEAETEVTLFSKQSKQMRGHRAEEVIPDWFHNRDIKKHTPKIETAAEAKERLEMDRLLASFA